MSEWQPIETAPKDGRKVLLVWPELLGRNVLPLVVGAWTGTRWSRPKKFNAVKATPTHWLPIPPLPEASTPYGGREG